MNTSYVKVNILQNTYKGSVLRLFVIIFLSYSFSINYSFSQMTTSSTNSNLFNLPKTPTVPKLLKIEKYSWSNKNFLKEVNKERTKKKLSILKENTELNRLAKLRLDDMIKNNYFAHESPTGNGIDELLDTSNYNYEWRGENLAYGDFNNEADVTKSWMNSKWHKYNILYKNFEEVGTAHTVTSFKGGKYLVVAQVFGKEIKNNNLAKK